MSETLGEVSEIIPKNYTDTPSQMLQFGNNTTKFQINFTEMYYNSSREKRTT